MKSTSQILFLILIAIVAFGCELTTPNQPSTDSRIYYVDQESLDDWFCCKNLHYFYPIGNDFESALDSLKRMILPKIEADLQDPKSPIYKSEYIGVKLDSVIVYDSNHTLVQDRDFIAVGFAGNQYYRFESGFGIEEGYFYDYPLLQNSFVIDSNGGLYTMNLPDD